MGWSHKAGHADKSQKGIVDALRKVGASVVIISRVGRGAPDLCVGWGGRTLLIECKSITTEEGKDGYTRTRRTRVDEGQKDFAAAWRGGPLHIVHTPEEALAAIGATPRQPATSVRPVKHPAR